MRCEQAEDAVTTFSYDAMGRMVRASNADACLEFERDALGRVVRESCNGRTVHSSYDLSGHRTWRRTPGGATSRWSFSAAGRPLALRVGSEQLDCDHDACGREVRRRLRGGTLVSCAWDASQRLVTRTLPAAVDPAERELHYEYRSDGYLVGVAGRARARCALGVDALGRVTARWAPGAHETYRYDGAGRIVDAQWPATGIEDHARLGARAYSETLLRRAGRARYTYDGQGRVVRQEVRLLSGKARVWQYQWDARDRLREVQTPDGRRWRYFYDPLGRRIAQQLCGPGDTGPAGDVVEFVWDGFDLAEQCDGREITTWDWGRKPGAL